jgi:hypothetical protein
MNTGLARPRRQRRSAEGSERASTEVRLRRQFDSSFDHKGYKQLSKLSDYELKDIGSICITAL